MYEEQLKELSLTDNEVRIYLLLLKVGMLGPSKIAQALNLHRGYVYDALERMHEKQVVNSILQDNKKQFQATSPDNIVELLKLKLESFQAIVPNLTQLMNLEKEDTKVELHKGKHVYRVLLKDLFATVSKGETVLVIGVDEQNLMENVEPIYLKQYFTFIKLHDIKERIIISKGKKKANSANITYKFLDAKYIGNTQQVVYGNKVALFILGNPHFLIVIENMEVAKTYHKQFELLWKVAK